MEEIKCTTLKDSLEDYFPEGFDRDQIQLVMRELYFIITSDDSYIPNLMEEYVLANCIDTMQDTINMDESLLIQMPQRDEVKTAITEYLTEECGESPEEAKEIAESCTEGFGSSVTRRLLTALLYVRFSKDSSIEEKSFVEAWNSQY